ncbi:MAG: thioredoxin-dependent thiol peroxidase [Chloroflexota bacterium]
MADVLLQEGDAAPGFRLLSTSGEPIDLGDFKGRQSVVLYFYPRDDTPGCTVEACSFRDNIASVQGHGAAVLGVSPDDVESHQKFTEKFSLNFPLLADEGATISQAYGVWKLRERDGKQFMGIERSTFLIGTDGRIKKIWRQVNPNEHVPEVIEALKG